MALDDGCAFRGCLLPFLVAPLQVLRLLTTFSRNTSTTSVFFKLSTIPSKHWAISFTPAPLKHCCNFCVNPRAPALLLLYSHTYTTSVSSLEKSLAFLFVTEWSAEPSTALKPYIVRAELDGSLRLLARASTLAGCSHWGMIGLISTFVCAGEDGGTWFLDLKSKGGKVGHGEPSDRADVVMSMTTDDFVKMFSGKFSTLLVYLF